MKSTARVPHFDVKFYNFPTKLLCQSRNFSFFLTSCFCSLSLLCRVYVSSFVQFTGYYSAFLKKRTPLLRSAYPRTTRRITICSHFTKTIFHFNPFFTFLLCFRVQTRTIPLHFHYKKIRYFCPMFFQ